MNWVAAYCIGVVTQALYFAVKRIFWSPKKVQDYNRGLDAFEAEGVPIRKMVPVLLCLMCLLWPYVWFERLFLKR